MNGQQPVDDESTVVVPRTVNEAVPGAADEHSDETVVVARPVQSRPAVATDDTTDPGLLPSPLLPPTRAVYSARSVKRQSAQERDASRARLDPPPTVSSSVETVAGREQLPSVVHRSTRRRVLTLVGYAGVVIISIVGLITIINMAFDGG